MMPFHLALIFFALVQHSVSVDGQRSTLQFVHALWRHGDRNTVATFPTDVNNSVSTWPQGFGELTTLGMRNQFRLGQFIKKRYEGFLSSDYSAYEIYVQSTSFNRTLMSAQVNLAGMYPPSGSLVWNPNISWSPIPIHSKPMKDDPILSMDAPCPKYDELSNDVFKSSAAKKIEQDYAETFEFLRQKTGLPLKSLKDIGNVYDPLFCERAHNDTHVWPSWMNESLMETIVKLSDLETALMYSTAAIKRLRGGLLLGDIVKRMNASAAGTLDHRLKYYAYSAHDVTIVALLENLDVFNGIEPPYAAAVFVELHEIDGVHVMRVFYYNDTSRAPFELEIPECTSPCRLDTLVKFAEPRVPSDWFAECGLSHDENVWKIVALSLVGLLTLLVFISSGLALAFVRVKHGRDREALIVDEP